MATLTHNSSTATTQSQADDILTCAACGAANAADSSFCRKCGEQLIAASVTSIDASVAPDVPPTDVKRTSTVGDETRARHLLDRAFALAERGDMAGAVLACRQSVALAPDVPQGFSMLGLLLERNGDLQGAANAYTRVLHLAPGSRLEEESLARLRASIDSASSSRRKTATTFNFDDNDLDLQADDASDNRARASVVPTAAVPVAAAIPAVAADAVASADKHGTQRLTPNNATPVAASIGTMAPASVGVAAPLRTTSAVPASIPAISALNFDVVDEPQLPLWRQIAARPNFYWSGLPLAGAALLGLLVMSWGRSNALSHLNAAPATTLSEVPKTQAAPVDSGVTDAANTTVPDYSVNTPPRATGGVGPNDSLPFGSAPRPAPAAQVVPNNAAPNNSAANSASNRNSAAGDNRRVQNSSTRTSGRSSSAPQPSFPSPAQQVIPPAMPSMLPPVRTQPSTLPGSTAIEVTPSYGQSNANSNVASSGGAPFGATAPKSSGYITLTRPRSPASASSRPSNNASSAERAAANASSSGRGNDAIDSINSALQNGGDTGWRYQQRALLFLERGDNQRAADDFQTAIAAYRDQVNRGERVSEAKAGIQACQSGLRLALANAR